MKKLGKQNLAKRLGMFITIFLFTFSIAAFSILQNKAAASPAAFSPDGLLTAVSGVTTITADQVSPNAQIPREIAAPAAFLPGVRVMGSRTNEQIGEDTTAWSFQYKNAVYLDDVGANNILFSVSGDAYDDNHITVLKFRMIDATDSTKYIEIEFSGYDWLWKWNQDEPWFNEHNSAVNVLGWISTCNGGEPNVRTSVGNSFSGYSIANGCIWTLAAPTIKYDSSTKIITFVEADGYSTEEAKPYHRTVDIGSSSTIFNNSTTRGRVPDLSGVPVILEVTAKSYVGLTNKPAPGVVVNTLAGVSLSGETINPAAQINVKNTPAPVNVSIDLRDTLDVNEAAGGFSPYDIYDIVYGPVTPVFTAAYEGEGTTGSDITSSAVDSGIFTPPSQGKYTLQYFYADESGQPEEYGSVIVTVVIPAPIVQQSQVYPFYFTGDTVTLSAWATNYDAGDYTIDIGIEINGVSVNLQSDFAGSALTLTAKGTYTVTYTVTLIEEYGELTGTATSSFTVYDGNDVFGALTTTNLETGGKITEPEIDVPVGYTQTAAGIYAASDTGFVTALNTGNVDSYVFAAAGNFVLRYELTAMSGGKVYKNYNITVTDPNANICPDCGNDPCTCEPGSEVCPDCGNDPCTCEEETTGKKRGCGTVSFSGGNFWHLAGFAVVLALPLLIKKQKREEV